MKLGRLGEWVAKAVLSIFQFSIFSPRRQWAKQHQNPIRGTFIYGRNTYLFLRWFLMTMLMVMNSLLGLKLMVLNGTKSCYTFFYLQPGGQPVSLLLWLPNPHIPAFTCFQDLSLLIEGAPKGGRLLVPGLAACLDFAQTLVHYYSGMYNQYTHRSIWL